jgi:hypothetical protein
VDQPIHLPSFSDKLQLSQQVFELGRDDHLDLRIRHGRVKYSYPEWIER